MDCRHINVISSNNSIRVIWNSQTLTYDIGVEVGEDTNIVTSVFGRIGDVVAQYGDYTVEQVIGAAPILSPDFQGIPLADTAPFGTSTRQIASTEFVQDAINDLRNEFNEEVICGFVENCATITNITNNITEVTQEITNLSSVVNNFVTEVFQGTYLLDGGQIVWLQDYTYQVSAGNYVILGETYHSEGGEITLEPADSDDDRIDLVVYDTSGNVVVITGVPSDNPQEPSYDPDTQIPLAFIHVIAGTTEDPCMSSIITVYKENAGTGGGEWTTVSSNGAIVTDSNVVPKTGSFSIEGTAVPQNAFITFTPSSPVDFTNITQLNFYILSKGTWGGGNGNGNNKKKLSIALFSSGVQVGTPVTIQGSGTYGFDSNNITNYQQIAIPKTAFGVTNQSITSIRFMVVGSQGTMGFYLDDITLDNNCVVVPQPPSSGFTLHTANTASVTLAGDGTLASPLTATAVIPPAPQLRFGKATEDAVGAEPRDFNNPSNSVAISSGDNTYTNQEAELIIDGTNVSTPLVGLYAQTVGAAAWSRIKLQADACSLESSTGTYTISNLTDAPTVDQIIVWDSGDNRIYVRDFPAEAEPFASTDTATVNFSGAGTTGSPLTADLIVGATDNAQTNLMVWDGTNVKLRTVASLPVTTITANNGLTMSSSTNAQWGGTLLQDTTITANTFKTTFTGNVNDTVLQVTQTASSGARYAIQGDATASVSGTGLVGLGGNVGVQGISTNGYGASFNGGTAGLQSVGKSGTTAIAAIFTVNPASTNTFTEIVQLQKSTTGTRAAGIGGYISWFIEDDTNNPNEAGRIGYTLTDVANATRTGAFHLWVTNNGASARKFSIAGSGQGTLDSYGAGTFTGTPTKWLAVTSTGAIIEQDPPSAGTSYTADNGVSLSTTTFQLGAPNNSGVAFSSNRWINTSTSTLTIRGSNTSYPLQVETTNASGAAAEFRAVAGPGVRAWSLPSTTNAIVKSLYVMASSSGTAANNFGAGIDFFASTAGTGASTQEIGVIGMRWKVVDHPTRTSETVFTGTNNAGAATELLLIDGGGQLKPKLYGVGTFTGTVAKYLAVTSAGAMIEVDPSGVGGTYTADNAITLTGSNFQLGGTGIQNTSIAWGAFSFTNSFNSQANNHGLILSSTSTAVTNQQAVLKLDLSGALSNSTVTNYGIMVDNNRTGTGINSTGIYSSALTMGVHARSSAGTGLFAFSSTGTGASCQSTSGTALQATSTSGTAVSGTSNTGKSFSFGTTGLTTNNATAEIGNMVITTASGTAGANGLGGHINYQIETNVDGNSGNAVKESFWFTDATNAAFSGAWGISTASNVTMTMRLDVGTGGGNVRILTPGKALGITSPDGTIWYVTVNNSGVLSTSSTAP